MAHYSATNVVGKVSLHQGSCDRPDTKINICSCVVPTMLAIGMVHFKLPENYTMCVLSHILQDSSVTCCTKSYYCNSTVIIITILCKQHTLFHIFNKGKEPQRNTIHKKTNTIYVMMPVFLPSQNFTGSLC
jgi:hypothetical protein